MKKTNLKLAIQKGGRLTEETLQFLRSSGLEFESFGQKLFATCRNFPVDILYVRNGDIPDYVASGTVDLGIVGQNVLYEKRPIVKKILNLRFGFCSLNIAVLKESDIKSISDLKDKKIATSYPNSTRDFFRKKNISVEIVKINGAVELAPTIGISMAISDLVSTGSTMELNDLKVIEKIYDSEAVLITNKFALKTKNELINKLLTRFEGVLSAKNYKYVMMNAPKTILPKLQKIIPGLKSPTVSDLAKNGWISVQSVIKEDIFWETIERLKQVGATGIIVMPIEKMMI